jgi:hypothetical protein
MEVTDYCVATDTTPTRPYRRFRQAAPERTVKTLICPMCLLLDSSDCRSGRASDLPVIPDGLGNQTRRLFCCRHGFLALPERKPSGQASGLVVGQPRTGFHSIPQVPGHSSGLAKTHFGCKQRRYPSPGSCRLIRPISARYLGGLSLRVWERILVSRFERRSRQRREGPSGRDRRNISMAC